MNRLGSRALRILMLAVLPLALAGCGINEIPTKQQRAKAAFADLQADYQRRADLVPNLVQTVQAYAQQEHAVLTDVTRARAAATGVNIDPTKLNDPQAMQRFQAAQDQLSGAIGRLLVVSERYPDLKSNQNFLALQSQLEGTENRIAVARRDYNEAVRDFNTTLIVFPSIFWAKTLYSSYQPMQMFQATPAAQNAPTVNFNLGYGQPAAGSPPATSSPPAK